MSEHVTRSCDVQGHVVKCSSDTLIIHLLCVYFNSVDFIPTRIKINKKKMHIKERIKNKSSVNNEIITKSCGF